MENLNFWWINSSILLPFQHSLSAQAKLLVIVAELVLGPIMINRSSYTFFWCTEQNENKSALGAYFISVERPGYFRKGEISVDPFSVCSDEDPTMLQWRYQSRASADPTLLAFQKARGICINSIKLPQWLDSQCQSGITHFGSVLLWPRGSASQ